MTVTLLALKPVLTRYGNMTGPTYTSLFQVSTRWNPFIALHSFVYFHATPNLYGSMAKALIVIILQSRFCGLSW